MYSYVEHAYSWLICILEAQYFHLQQNIHIFDSMHRKIKLRYLLKID
jgi:hypothetical protein